MNVAAVILALALGIAPPGAAPPVAPAAAAEPAAVPSRVVAPSPVTAPAPPSAQVAPAAAPVPVSPPAQVVPPAPDRPAQVVAPAQVTAPAGALPAPSPTPPGAPAAASGAANSAGGAPRPGGDQRAAAEPATAGTPVSPDPIPRPAIPPATIQAVIDKLGQGDRAFLAGDYRNALFAYQDAVYMAPGHAAARVKLGRAYLALRYPAQALAQAELALRSDPSSEDARRLEQDARNPPARAVPAPASPVPAREPAAAAAAAPQARVYRFVPQPETEPAAANAPAVAAAPAAPVARAAPRPDVASEPAVATDPGTPEPARPTTAPAIGAGRRYRTALELLARREFQAAVDELSEAIRIDPRLAVAYSARASGEFGLRRYREASDDYRMAASLDPDLGMPLYGLAECYRMLGDNASASEMYQRYAESRAPDVRDDLRTVASRRALELR